MKRASLFVLLSVAISACQTTPKQGEEASQTPETQPDKVLSRIDDLKSRASWIQEQRPFRQDGDKIVSQASTTIPGDHRVEAAYRVCFNSAKGAIATAIEQKLEFIFQQSSEGTQMDSVTAQFIGSEMASMTSSSLRPANQYWEKLATTMDSGERKTIYKIFCTVEMPQQDFKNKMMAAMRKAEGKDHISADFRTKVNAQWDRFVGSEAKGPASVSAENMSDGK